MRGGRARLDASRALAVLDHLHGRTTAQALELLSSVRPSRDPRPTRDAGHLVGHDLRLPRALLRAQSAAETQAGGESERGY